MITKIANQDIGYFAMIHKKWNCKWPTNLYLCLYHKERSTHNTVPASRHFVTFMC